MKALSKESFPKGASAFRNAASLIDSMISKAEFIIERLSRHRRGEFPI